MPWFGLCALQELGAVVQSQGLLQEEDWEEVKAGLFTATASPLDSAQLKQLDHQVCGCNDGSWQESSKFTAWLLSTHNAVVLFSVTMHTSTAVKLALLRTAS